MILRRIKLKDFQIYREFESSFLAITFIRGKNGTGKTTLGLEALMFCLWGYSTKNLADIPTRGKATTCSVEAELEHEGHTYIIERRIPTFLKISKDGQEVHFETKSEGQSYLRDLFGEPLHFKQFRMIDNEVGINFLDPKSATTFKKIIFSLCEEQFNKAKDSLARIRQTREVWNKDNAVIFPYAPSDKRREVINGGIFKLQETCSVLVKEDSELSQEEYRQNNLIGQIQGQIRNIQNQKSRMSATQCYACGQAIDASKNAQIIAQQERNIEELGKQLTDAQEVLAEIREIRSQGQPALHKVNLRIRKLSDLKTKLEGRLKQKDFIYTNSDVEIAKQAIKELDVISTSFLIRSIKNLEPIINEVLAKISYALEFDINDKGKFDMNLTDSEGEVFTYKDLSTGQKLMLQIAFKLALLIERGEEGLIIADEGLSSLDSDNLNHILAIFENFPFQLVFIIHHVNDVPVRIKTIDLDEVRVHEKNQRVAEEAVEVDS